MDHDIGDYVRKVGMRAGKIAALDRCELCGSDAIAVLCPSVVVRDAIRAPIRVAACGCCGLIFQLDRFAPMVYHTYYAERYRMVISGAADPSEEFLQDQIARGRSLFRSLLPYLPASGTVLDVGCSAGGLLLAFAEQGWKAMGIDPDRAAIRSGKARFNLDLTVGTAESMDIPDGTIDLIVIAGSLEHVADLDTVMNKCVAALATGGVLLVEGWAYAQARISHGFGHNQKRYFTQTSLANMFARYGLRRELLAHLPLSGPTRPHSVFGIARKCGIDDRCNERVDADVQALRRMLMEHDIR